MKGLIARKSNSTHNTVFGSFHRKAASSVQTNVRADCTGLAHKITRVVLAVVLAIGLLPSMQSSRAYGQDSGVQINNSDTTKTINSEYGSEGNANYVLLVDYSEANSPNYHLEFLYCDEAPSTYDDHNVVSFCEFFSYRPDSWSDNFKYISQVDFVDTTRATSTAFWFSDFEQLECINGLEKLDTRNVKSMQSMFENCKSLSSLDLSGFDTRNVENTSGMFGNDSALTAIYVSRHLWNTSNCNQTTDMFNNCFNVMGSEGTCFDSNMTDGTYACIDGHNYNLGYFSELEANYALLVENGTIEIVDGVYNQAYRLVFMFCESEPISYEGCNVLVAYQDFQDTQTVFWSYFADRITQVDFCNVVYPLTTAYWFSDFRQLTLINGLKYLDTSKITSMQSMFFDCMNLTNLDVSCFDTRKVTDMSYMFRGCENLKHLDVSSFNTNNVADMCWMFAGCGNLTSLDLSSFCTFSVYNMRRLFFLDSALTTIKVSRDLWDISNCKRTDMMFANCLELEGSRGTCYDSTKIDGTYARIDGGIECPGYLTGA